MAALPGVDHAGFVSHLPFDDSLPNWYDYVWQNGAAKDEQNALMADHRAASAGFFNSLGAHFVTGRNFDSAEEMSGRRVAIIDDVLAQQLWPGQTAVGKLINVAAQHGDFLNGPFAHRLESQGGVQHGQNFLRAERLYVQQMFSVPTHT